MTPLATIRSHQGLDGLQKALRARWIALRISGETMDSISGLTSAYASKLLAPYPPKYLGRSSLGPMMGCLGVMLLLVEDEDMMSQIAGRLGQRKNTSVRKPTSKRPRKSPLRGNSAWGKAMAARRMITMTPRQRSLQAKRAIRSRWRKCRPIKPS